MTEEMNLIAAMFDINKVKNLIANCPKDEIVILCSHWSINKPDYSNEDETNEEWDLDEFGEQLGQSLFINDYDDLCCDPHGIMSE